MLTRIRRRLEGDEGISLIEVLVAFTLLAVVFSASAASVTSSYAAVNQAESRTRAMALANEELENMRGVPWMELAFYPIENPPADSVLIEGFDEDDPRPAGSRAPRPTDDVERDGIEYSVSRTIEWAAGYGDDQDYKKLAVQVDWTDRGTRSQSLTVETIRAPTPSEQPGTPFVLSQYDVQPSTADVDANGNPVSSADYLRFEVRTSIEAQSVTATFEERDGTTTDWPLASSDGISWSSTYSTGTFANGDLVVTLTATRALPVEHEVLGTRVVRITQPVAFRSLAFDPPMPLCLDPGDPGPDVAVTVDFDGLVDEDEVLVSYEPSQVLPAEWVSSSISGSQFAATIPAGSYTLSTETRPESAQVTVTATRAGDTTSHTHTAYIEANRRGVTC